MIDRFVTGHWLHIPKLHRKNPICEKLLSVPVHVKQTKNIFILETSCLTAISNWFLSTAKQYMKDQLLIVFGV